MEVNNIVLFSEKKEKVKIEFLLETSKIICQWGKQNNLVFCLNFEFLLEFFAILAGNKTKKSK